MSKEIRDDIEATADAVIDIVKTSDAENVAVDDYIDNVAEAIEDVEYDDHTGDGDDIDMVEGLDEEDVVVYADSEEDAAELELMDDASVDDSMYEDEPEVPEDEVIDAVKEAMIY